MIIQFNQIMLFSILLQSEISKLGSVKKNLLIAKPTRVYFVFRSATHFCFSVRVVCTNVDQSWSWINES